MNDLEEPSEEMEDTQLLRETTSPLNVEGVDLDLSTGEILRYVAEGRRSAQPIIARAAVGTPIPALSAEEMRILEVMEDIYSMAWRNTVEGIPLVTPLYYTHPEEDDAYACPQTYWFGSELIAAPFTAPTETDLGLSRQRVWLPEGIWFDFFTGKQFGDGWHTVYGDWSTVPVFAKAGAIVPLGPMAGWGGVQNPAELTLHAFAGADGKFVLYEDDGTTTAYRQGNFAQTPFVQSWRGDSLALAIGQVQGDVRRAPASRNYHVVVHGIKNPSRVALLRTGQAGEGATRYAEATSTLTISLVGVRPDEQVELVITRQDGQLLAAAVDPTTEARALLRAFQMQTDVKWRIDADLPRLMSGELTLARYPLTAGQQEALHYALAGLGTPA